jgi:nicotinate-nucleotide adenylyltransferase
MSKISEPEPKAVPVRPNAARCRIAVFGGSFDPLHCGHVAIATAIIAKFRLDEFIFMPAFHAPHKKRLAPTSAYDRYAMLCLVTAHESRMSVSKMEIEAPSHPYTVETLTTLKRRLPDAEIFFVMGSDSWMDITSWREWKSVLTLSNHIVMTRPGIDISFDHVTDDIRERIFDLRGMAGQQVNCSADGEKIYFTDIVDIDISASDIRQKIRDADGSWREDVPVEVANYIEKYQIYN